VTDTQLTTLSTLVWLIGTIVLFILLAHWSAGGSWGISSAIARGLTGWADRGSGPAPGGRFGDDLRPIQPPRLDRLWGQDPTHASSAPTEPLADRSLAPPPAAGPGVAEIEELGSRRLS
jgi:hypothetical protein